MEIIRSDRSRGFKSSIRSLQSIEITRRYDKGIPTASTGSFRVSVQQQDWSFQAAIR